MRKLGAAVAGLFVAAAVPAAAASAAPVTPELQFAHVTLTPNDGKQQIVDFWAYEQSFTLHDVTAVIDTSQMPAGVTAGVWFPEIDKNCKDATGSITCTFDTLPSDEGMAFITFVNYVSKDAEVGAEGTASVKVTSRELGTVTRSTKVTVAEGVDLAVDQTDQDTRVKPGGTVAVPLSVRNNGETAITGVDVFFFIDPWYGMAKHYSNCVYGTTAGYCHFDTELKANTSYALSEDMGVKIRGDVPAPSTIGQTFDWYTPNDNSDNIDLVNGQKPKHGTDGALSLRAKPAALAKSKPQTDISSLGLDYQTALFEVTGTRNGDVAAVGAQVKGATGATVTAKVGVRNLGPAFEFGFPNPAAQVTVTAPAGTTVVSVPDGCVKAGAAYECTTTASPLDVNASVTWPFKLRIDKSGTLTGSVVAKSFQPDVTKDNDAAKLVVNPPAGVADSAGQGGNDGGGLPITGAPAAWIGGAGVLLLGGGAAAYVISRRKRARFVA
ncbi:hypothetical protein [Actinoplanes sp. NPDC051411]|uniref:hypothetical protein n=1 Tax=Actinoplanes sp. NPDC051411 TaxID=3155522 RepID=UPI003436B6A6